MAAADDRIGFARGAAAAIRGGASRRRGSTTGATARAGGRTAIVSPQVLHFILKARPESCSETTYVRPQLAQLNRTLESSNILKRLAIIS